MKNSLLLLSIMALTPIVQAEYLVKYPLEESKGGNLADGSIIIKQPDPVWTAISPTFTDWTTQGPVTGCSNWTPLPSTVTLNQPFTQTATDCSANQTRSKQEREQETRTQAIRNTGNPLIENRVLAG